METLSSRIAESVGPSGPNKVSFLPGQPATLKADGELSTSPGVPV